MFQNPESARKSFVPVAPVRSVKPLSADGTWPSQARESRRRRSNFARRAASLRRQLLSIPGWLTRHARGWTLRLPARWPWHGDYITALNAIRALPAAI